jgi:hypothetical protein
MNAIGMPSSGPLSAAARRRSAAPPRPAPVRGDRDEGVERGLALDALQEVPRELDARYLAARHEIGQFADGEIVKHPYPA